MYLRILPMSNLDKEFVGKTISEIQQDFFENHLKINEEYLYQKNGLDAEDGDIVLFQMESQIIAMAKIKSIISFEEPTKEDGNYGAIMFRGNTVKTFKPINAEELQKYIPTFKKFSQVKYRFKLGEVKLNELLDRMEIK